MATIIPDTTKTPLTDSILASLRQQLRLLNEGDRLPTLRQLMKQLGVSQLSVQTALEQLKREGRIAAHVGRGTFVARTARGPEEECTTVAVFRYDYPSRRGEEITRALHHALQAHQCRMLTLMCGEEDHAMEVLRDAPPSDAYILQPLHPNIPVRLLELLRRRSQAVVVEGFPVESVDVDAVVNDELLAVEIAVRHLIQLGHHRIVFAAGEPTPLAGQRLRFFPVVMRWAGLADGPDSILLAGTKLGESSHDHMRHYFTKYLAEHSRPPFSAMVVGGHASALGALEALKGAGLSVPQDVSVVVLDNPDLSSPAEVPLTMAGRTSQRIAEDLVKRLQWRLAHLAEPFGTAYEKPELVVRDSTRRVTTPDA